MIRGLRGTSPIVVVAMLLSPGLLATLADGKDLAPFRVALDVHWGGDAGSDAFRDDLARSLAGVLASRCFASVAADGEGQATPSSELVLAVRLSDPLDETRFDDSIAVSLQPGDPSQELRRVARFQVTVDATLSARASDVVVQRKHMFANVYRRPLIPGEDPQASARAEAIERIVVDLAKWLRCGQAKLERRVRDALGTDSPPESSPR
jgi:hypothetical protein